MNSHTPHQYYKFETNSFRLSIVTFNEIGRENIFVLNEGHRVHFTTTTDIHAGGVTGKN